LYIKIIATCIEIHAEYECSLWAEHRILSVKHGVATTSYCFLSDHPPGQF